MNRMKDMTKVLLLIMVSLMLMIGCTRDTEGSVTIADQYGLAYAPLQIAKLQQLIEKRVPDAQVNWVQMANTAAIREAMVSGRVDVGFGAIPPFLIGWDHGMDWKIATGLSRSPLGLVTLDPELQSLRDFSAEDRIALPQPGSIQHMLLSMAAEEQLGSADALDTRIITLSHPDGVSALLSGSIQAHFTSPPYLFTELEQPGAHMLVSGTEAFGEPFSFIVGYASRACYDSKQKLYRACIEAVQEAVTFIEEHPGEAAQLLSQVYEMDQELILKYLTAEGMVYDTQVLGIRKFSEFMHSRGYIEEEPRSLEELFWD